MMSSVRLSSVLGICAIAFVGIAPAAADPVASGTCYARSYTAAHLKANPRQKVRSITLRQLDKAQAGVIAPGKTALLVGFRFRNNSGHFQRYAECDSQGASLACNMEGDAGAFVLETSARGGLRLQATRRLGVEGDTMIEFGGRVSDDNVFLLRPAAAGACASLKAP